MLRSGLTALALPAFMLLAACSGSHSNSGSRPATGDGTGNPAPAPTTAPTPAPTTTTTNTTTNDDAQRVIAEADIVQIGGTSLYAISNTGKLSIIDVSKANQLTLLGEVMLTGSPYEMYLLPNNRLAVLLTDALGGGSAVMVLDAKQPAAIQIVGSVYVHDTIFDSRLDGNILYVVASGAADTTVTSFDLSVATPLAAPVATLPLAFPSTSIIFGNGHLYVGGSTGIELVDVSDAGGKIVDGTHITTVGPITERWQMSEQATVLRVVSQAFSQPVIETFQVTNSHAVAPLGNAVLTLPTVEPLRSVAFDTDRAYATTFQATDPLYVIDLSNPAQPVPRGMLSLSGYLFYMEPHGNRLLGLGVDDTSQDHLNVSLIDVSNLDQPALLTRVEFGGDGGDLAEDQNEIQKAFVANQDGLITVPVLPDIATDQCQIGGGVQLIDWNQDTLTKQAFVQVAGNPRRALTDSTELVAISDSNVTAFDITNHAVPFQTADITVGSCVVRTATETATDSTVPNQPITGGDYFATDDDGGDDGIGVCTATRVGGHSSSSAALVGLGLVAAAIARRRAKLSAD